MYSYLAYGLKIRSEFQLPELARSTSRGADVVIKAGKVTWRPKDQAEKGYWASSDLIYLFWKEVGAFRISRGREVIVDVAPGVEDYFLRVFILGAVLAAALHQRQLLVLHASAVNVAGGAVGFLGDKGWGKSTLAASMQARSHVVMSDDVVAMNVSGGQDIHVVPGFPQFKLWPDAIATLGVNPDDLPRLHPAIDKRVYQVPCDFQTTSVPLRSLYILDEGEFLEIEPLKPQEAVMQLVRHTYLARYLKATETNALNLQQCTAVAAAIPIFLLRRPRRLPLLPETAKLLEQNVAQLAV